MALGYLSLFYEDAPVTFNVQMAKDSIYANAKVMLSKPAASNSLQKQNIEQIIENKLLKNIEGLMQQGVAEGMRQVDQIHYWEINMQTANAYVRAKTTEIGQIGKAMEYIEKMQNEVSNAIEKGRGIVSLGAIEELKSCQQVLENLAASFGNKVESRGFESAFNSSFRGAVSKVQGALHETAGAIAGYLAQEKINKELSNMNSQLRVTVEQTGGKLLEDSKIAAQAQAAGKNLGVANNAKNDLTITITSDDGAQIVWHKGLSLKSTSSNNPQKVHIMSPSLGSLLNKSFDQQTYLQAAAALGKGDWAGTSKGIAGLAKQHNISIPSSTLEQQWKEMVYSVIYGHIIDSFTGLGAGGMLNNAQYLIVNSKVISMYDIFQKLEELKENIRNNMWSIPGIELGGIVKAINRSRYTKENINAFIPPKNNSNVASARIERSTVAWDNVNKIIQDTKLRISLKYSQLGLADI